MNQSVHSLNLPKTKIKELHKKGYNYCCDLPKSGFNDILDHSNNESRCRKTAFDIYENEQMHSNILSYNDNLDHVLRNEIVPKSIVELTGGPGCGKTQICLLLTISMQIPIEKDKKEAIYLCTNKNFSSERLKEIALNCIKTKANGLQIQNLLKHVHFMKIDKFNQLINCLKHLETFLEEKNIKLLIIDSITYPLRYYETHERNSLINKLFQHLRYLINKFNFSVIITNELTTKITNTASYLTPSLGSHFYHLVNTRILLEKLDLNYFKAKLIKSIIKPYVETIFLLN